ncbi:Glycerol uptake [Mycena indigotica]|uniref:Glycerol uptake n=1 Tax=Mycena indigotica TaxID=2126181 RepID=A0A8H6SA17_9AGAR|nr:Glycerol uptake [Mycena indigotica]KAF7294930.1 Glycerol uptake [Mycena indigotica]
MHRPVVRFNNLRTSRPRVFAAFERRRHTSASWLVECYAEALGVFLYTYMGVGSQALYVLGNILQLEGASSGLQIGLAYACGILLAITVCNATSGGHFNPAVTITRVLFEGFPPLKGLRYMVAQVFGGYIACLLVYVQYKTFFGAVDLVLEAAGPGHKESVFWTPSGPGGVLALSVTVRPDNSNKRVFVNEFVVDFVLGTVIWATLDPTNELIPPFLGAVIVSLAYAAAIWSFGGIGLAANAARDVGGRLAGLTVFGMGASGGPYAALAALTNIPATILSRVMYEFMISDSYRVIPAAHLEVIEMHKDHSRLRSHGLDSPENESDIMDSESKGHIGEVERV